MRLLLILAVVLWTGQIHAAVHAAEEPATLCEVCVLAEAVEQAEPGVGGPAPLVREALPQGAPPAATAAVIPPPARAPPARGPPSSN